jgi:uncharacterized protein (DUF2267 family)
MDDRKFFQDVSRRLACDERRAESVTLVVFEALRDRLTPKEAGDVAAQLPVPLKRLWGANRRGSSEPEKLHAPEFVGRVQHRAALHDEREAERAVRAVFGALQLLLGSHDGLTGEAGDVYSQLPKDLKLLWVSANNHE